MVDTFDWFAGHGYGVARTLFVEEQPWAGDAHNSVLALLVSTGVMGLVLLAAAAVAVGTRLVRDGPRHGSPLTIAASSLLALVFVNAMTTDVLAEPTIGFALFNLVAAHLFVRGAHEQPERDVRQVAVVSGTSEP
jgi:O-antigen ligase